MIWASNIFQFFLFPTIFFTNKKNDSICWHPWGEFGGHWPKSLVLIQSQMGSNESWTALVDCLGKATCWQRAQHTLEAFMRGTGGGMSWVGWGLDMLGMLGRLTVVEDVWLVGVMWCFFWSLWGCKVLKVSNSIPTSKKIRIQLGMNLMKFHHPRSLQKPVSSPNVWSHQVHWPWRPRRGPAARHRNGREPWTCCASWGFWGSIQLLSCSFLNEDYTWKVGVV